MKIGLVLAGGGGKGGYQIGVWKYLKEIGLDERISVISGTSVGGLNAALMGISDYETAERIWTKEIEDKILDTTSSKNKKFAIFSRTGLLKIIDDYVDLSRIKICRKIIYVTCFNTSRGETEYFNLSKYETAEIKSILCATSAIPIAFQVESIQECNYFDGGLKDNVPLKPLLDERCTHALIINLGDDHVDYSGFDIKTVVIHPSVDLGGFITGTGSFSLEKAATRINIGYEDCKKIYSLQIKSLLEENMEKDQIQKVKKVNEMNDNQVLLETLKHISNKVAFVNEIQCNTNIDFQTMGGKIWWKNVAEFGGWKFQQNNISKMIRLLSPQNKRMAWGDYQKMVSVCKNFLISLLHDEYNSKIKFSNEMFAQSKDERSVENRLLKLSSLRTQGLITEDEYNKRKNDILSEI